MLPPSINHDFNFTVVLIKKLGMTRIICEIFIFPVRRDLSNEDTAKGASCPGAI